MTTPAFEYGRLLGAIDAGIKEFVRQVTAGFTQASAHHRGLVAAAARAQEEKVKQAVLIEARRERMAAFERLVELGRRNRELAVRHGIDLDRLMLLRGLERLAEAPPIPAVDMVRRFGGEA